MKKFKKHQAVYDERYGFGTVSSATETDYTYSLEVEFYSKHLEDFMQVYYTQDGKIEPEDEKPSLLTMEEYENGIE